MTVDRSNLGGKNVVVGIRFDEHLKELLDWAIVKVADPGDNVVAIHVCRSSDSDRISKVKSLLDEYLEEYQGLCFERKVALSTEVLKGNSIRKVLVVEAKKYNASAVIVGISKHTTLGGWDSMAKYCARRLPQSIDVMAIYNGKIVLSRCSIRPHGGPGDDPKPSFYFIKDCHTIKDDKSEFGESEVSEMSRLSCDQRDVDLSLKNEVVGCVARQKRSSLHSISLPVEDFTKQRPGWPLLQTASSLTQPVLEARKLSVVQWVMNLPHRSSAEISTRDELDDHEELPNDLERLLANSTSCRVYSNEFLKMATCEFSAGNLIGKGGCNSVYKGILPEGQQVAIKILESSKEILEDFKKEVQIMTTVKHRRITSLRGVCVDNNKSLVSVYDFLSKGNLEENLHDTNRTKNPVLTWEIRFKIAVGIAEALNYLHNECPRPVIHRDIKSSNVLLTDELEPQLSDFGLAIWGPTMSSFLTDSDVVGTFGYLAPEYFMYGKVSQKIDVYAFGVVLLELLSGRKPIGDEFSKDQESIVMWAKPKLENGDFTSILDPNLHGNINEVQMERMALAAKSCLTQAARLRPNIAQILKILNGEECMDRLKSYDDSEKHDDNDDEVYPDSSAESHLSLAFLDVNDLSRSFSSMDRSSSPISIDDYLKTWSRSTSLE